MAVIDELATPAARKPRGPLVLRLAVARVLLFALLSAPVFIAVSSTASSGPARSLYYTETARPLPLLTLVALFAELGGAFGLALAICLALALLLSQLLTAAALTLLGARRAPGRTERVRTAMFHDGLLQLWPFLRAALFALAGLGAGAGVLAGVFGKVAAWGDRANWSADALSFWLPLAQAAATSVWALLAGAWALWMRAFVVVDERRRVRRAGWLAFRSLLRLPVRGIFPFALMAFATQLAGSALMFGWLQSGPDGALGVGLWAALSLLLLFAQSLWWAVVLRSVVRLLDSGKFYDLRTQPDAPFYWVRRAIDLVRRRGRAAPAAADVPTVSQLD